MIVQINTFSVHVAISKQGRLLACLPNPLNSSLTSSPSWGPERVVAVADARVPLRKSSSSRGVVYFARLHSACTKRESWTKKLQNLEIDELIGKVQ